MNTGCLRHCALMPCPGWILEMSTSVVASASTSADGAICTSSGASAATRADAGEADCSDVQEVAAAHAVLAAVGPAVCGTSADRALVAIIPLCDADVLHVPEGT